MYHAIPGFTPMHHAHDGKFQWRAVDMDGQKRHFLGYSADSVVSSWQPGFSYAQEIAYDRTYDVSQQRRGGERLTPGELLGTFKRYELCNYMGKQYLSFFPGRVMNGNEDEIKAFLAQEERNEKTLAELPVMPKGNHVFEVKTFRAEEVLPRQLGFTILSNEEGPMEPSLVQLYHLDHHKFAQREDMSVVKYYAPHETAGLIPACGDLTGFLQDVFRRECTRKRKQPV